VAWIKATVQGQDGPAKSELLDDVGVAAAGGLDRRDIVVRYFLDWFDMTAPSMAQSLLQQSPPDGPHPRLGVAVSSGNKGTQIYWSTTTIEPDSWPSAVDELRGMLGESVGMAFAEVA